MMTFQDIKNTIALAYQTAKTFNLLESWNQARIKAVEIATPLESLLVWENNGGHECWNEYHKITPQEVLAYIGLAQK